MTGRVFALHRALDLPNRPHTRAKGTVLGKVSARDDNGASEVIANPVSLLVAGARFELWTRPLTFEFVLNY